MSDTIFETPRIRTRDRRRTDAAKLPPAVNWSEGMLLAPQHFQLQSRRNEALLQFHAAAVSPFHWGLLDLEIESLKNDTIIIRGVEAVMPDGLVVSFRATAGDGASELSIDLAKRDKDVESGKSTIYLCVAARDAGERFKQRYAGQRKLVDDETTGEKLEVDVLEPRLQLELTDELASSHVGFPIAKVMLREGKIAEVRYEPPWLAVRPGSVLFNLCNGEASSLRQTATSRARSISGEWSSTHAAQVLEKKLLVYGLFSALPQFEALLDSNAAHPFALYTAMTSILGHVAVGLVPARMPAYDHDDALPCFLAVQKEIAELLDKAVKEPYTTYVFDRGRDEYRVQINQKWIGCEMLLGVRIPGGRTQDQIHEWIMGSTIGSRASVDSLRKRRVTGVGRKRVREHELLPMSGVVFYSIDSRETDFPKPGDELVIANASEGEEARPEDIVLYVRMKD
jgi:type VI secretion system protein ImpJ